MDPKDVIIATPTFYPKGIDDPRFGFAARTVSAAFHNGYPMCVVDGSPDERVRERFKTLGARVFPELNKGLGPNKRQSVYVAMETARDLGASFIAMIEPEKFDMIRLLPQWIAPLSKGADVVVAHRSEESWKTYPAFQVETEQEANRAFRDAIGLPLDIMFGPVAFRVGTALNFFLNPFEHLLLTVLDTYIQHYAAIVARTKGLRVVASEPLDFEYPPEQRKQEEDALNDAIRAKRISQRDTLIHAYKTFAAQYGFRS